MTRRKKNPALAVAALAPSVLSIAKPIASRARRALRQKIKQELRREETKAGPKLGGTSRIQRGAALTSAASFSVPVPVSQGVVSRGSQWIFGAAPVQNGASGVRISGKTLWAQILTDATPHAGNPILTAGNANVSSLTFDPDDTQTMFPPLTSFSTCFARYCLRKARVIFTPVSGTSLGVALAMAVTTDAAIVQSTAASGWSGRTATWIGYLMEQSNSVTGPVWESMALDVPCDSTMRYVYQTGADSSISPAEERQDHAFGIGVSLQNGAGSSLAATTLYGYLHIEYTIDFYEVVATANETSLLRLEKRVRDLRQRVSSVVERKEETPARDDEKAPISSSSEVQIPTGLSGGWSVVPGWRGVAVRPEPPTPPPRVQSLKS